MVTGTWRLSIAEGAVAKPAGISVQKKLSFLGIRTHTRIAGKTFASKDIKTHGYSVLAQGQYNLEAICIQSRNIYIDIGYKRCIIVQNQCGVPGCQEMTSFICTLMGGNRHRMKR